MTKKILYISYFALFLITPLLFTKHTSELFEYNKMMFVYALTIIISGSWILRMVGEKQLIFKRTILDIPLALFLLSQIISTIFSIDPHTSIWGYYSRSNGGLLSIISYLILYWAFVSNFDKEDVLKFLKTAVISGVLVSLYSIPEHFGLSPSCIILTNEFTANCWVQDVQARVFGTIGQPNWLAAFLAMLIFPAIYLFLTSKKLTEAEKRQNEHYSEAASRLSHKTSPSSLLSSRAGPSSNFFLLSLYYKIKNIFPSKIFWATSAVLMYLAFTFTYSRGATLGLIAGFGVFLLSIFLTQTTSLRGAFSEAISVTKGPKTELKLLSIILLLFVLINIYFGSALTSFRLENSTIAARPSIIQDQAPSIGTQLENGGTESGQIRLIVWKGALEIFKAYPIFGSGVETFAYSYYQYRPLDHNLVSEWDFLYNKAHNEYLNYLATTGAFGFLTYMSIIITFFVSCILYLVSSKKPATNYQILTTSLLAGYTSYLVQNFFLFSVVNVALLFYLFPALAFVFTENTKPLPEKNIVNQYLNWLFRLLGQNSISKNIVRALGILVILVALNSLYTLWEADTFYKIGSDYNDLNNPGRAYSYLIEAVRLNSNEPLYLAELGNAAASSSIALSEEESTTSAELKDDAQFFTDFALSISPVNTTINRTAIRTYFSLALLDPTLQEKTMEIVNRAVALSPTDPKLLHNKGVILSQFDKINEATASLNQAINMKPNYRDARLSLADIYIKNNQKDLAKKEIDAVLKLIPGDPDALKLQEQLK